MGSVKETQKRSIRNNYFLKAFFLGLGLSFLVFIPFLLVDGGRFLFYGDFNVQQVPFYRLAHDAVRSGNLGWSHLTDLGANFVGSYSFYLLGSPFFWLTIPFPSEWVQYLMGPLLILKFACATLTGYIYIHRYTNPWTLCTPAIRLTHPEYNWELHGFPVDEGPGVIKHDGRIFITFSASGTDAMYCVGLLYADEDADLLSSSSWTKLPYPVFQSSKETGQYGLGHNSFTKSDDDSQDLIIYHGRQEERYLVEEDYQPLYDAGRNASVGKIYWDKNGMPDFSVPAMGIVCSEDRLKVKAEIIVE